MPTKVNMGPSSMPQQRQQSIPWMVCPSSPQSPKKQQPPFPRPFAMCSLAPAALATPATARRILQRAYAVLLKYIKYI